MNVWGLLILVGGCMNMSAPPMTPVTITEQAGSVYPRDDAVTNCTCVRGGRHVSVQTPRRGRQPAPRLAARVNSHILCTLLADVSFFKKKISENYLPFYLTRRYCKFTTTPRSYPYQSNFYYLAVAWVPKFLLAPDQKKEKVRPGFLPQATLLHEHEHDHAHMHV